MTPKAVNNVFADEKLNNLVTQPNFRQHQRGLFCQLHSDLRFSTGWDTAACRTFYAVAVTVTIHWFDISRQNNIYENSY